MTSTSLVWGGALGLALGVAYAASPLAVWFAAITVILFRWAGRGLADRERQYVWGILAVSLAIKVYAIAALALGSHRDIASSFFWDGDGVYLKQRALVLSSIWSGIPVTAEDVFHVFDATYGWSAYLYVLALLQYLLHLEQIGTVLEFLKPLEILRRDDGSHVLSVPLQHHPLTPVRHLVQDLREPFPRLTCR